MFIVISLGLFGVVNVFVVMVSVLDGSMLDGSTQLRLRTKFRCHADKLHLRYSYKNLMLHNA
jgi:hypothetical protein